MTIFYHLSTEVTMNGYFMPRVPTNHLKGYEESTIKRICVSPTVEGCFTAIGNGNSAYDANFMRRGYYLLFRIDTEKLGIEKKHIITNRKIYRNGWVPDANVTKECWITKEFQVPKEDTLFIQIRSFEQVQVTAYPYQSLKTAVMHFNGDVPAAHKSLYGNSTPVVMETISLDYQTSKGLAGEKRFLFVQGEEEEQKVISFLKEEYKVEILPWDKGKVHFRLLEDGDLKLIFLLNLMVSWECREEYEEDFVA